MVDKEIGVRFTADDQISPTVRSLKQQVRELAAGLPEVIEKFGQTSAEAAGVAMRIAQIKDQMQDANSLVDAFNPDTKFKAFGATINTVVGGFTALTGAMGLLGVESEEVQKTLLKVQSALAISQGVAQLQEGIQSFKNLGAVILNTLGKQGLLGIGLAGIAAVGLALAGVFDSASVKTRTLKDSMKELNKATVEGVKEVDHLKNSFKQAEAGIITTKQALDEYNNGIGKTIGYAKDLNEAEKLTVDNAAKYVEVQGLKAQANYILSKSSEIAANAAIAEQKAGDFKNSPAFIRDAFAKSLDKQKQDAADLLVLVDGINAKIATASAGFKPGGKPEDAPKVAKAKTDEKKITDDFQEQSNLRGIIEGKLVDKRLNLRRMYIEEGRKLSEEELAAEQAEFDKEYAAFEDLQARKTALVEAEKQARLQQLGAISEGLTNLSDLVGKQTAAGKVLGIASAIINTYVGVTKALSAAPPPLNFIQAASVLIAGFAAVKNIVAVKVPGASSGGSVPSTPSVAAPLTVQRPQGQTTSLDQQSLNAIGAATTRAYVTESDLTNNMDRVRRLNRAARIG